MILFALYQATLICIGISLISVKSERQKPVDAAYNSLKCQRLHRQSDTLKADNENLKSHLERMEKTLHEQMQQESEIEKELHEFEMKLQALQTLLRQQESNHLKALKDSLGSLRTRKCKRQNSFYNDFKKFSQLQNTIAKRVDVETKITPKSNDLDDEVIQLEPLEQDNESFCMNFYVKTLEPLSGYMSILQNIDQKLGGGSEKFINESINHRNTIEGMADVVKHLDMKDEPEYCIRTTDKTTICNFSIQIVLNRPSKANNFCVVPPTKCQQMEEIDLTLDSNQPHPTNCVEYNSPHCSQNKCVIKNFIYGPEPFQVACDQLIDGGGWIVAQRRINGSVDFYRNWSEYKTGFGDLDGEFWLGLDKLHALTRTLAPVELLIQLKDHDDIMKYAKFSEFFIGNETELYELKEAGGYEGNAGDSFSQHKGQKFTTKDKDNDGSYSANCAVAKAGAWWYNNCHWCNLNGMYYKTGLVPGSKSGQGISWYDFHEYEYSLKFVQMMIRPTKDILRDMELR